MYIGKHENQLIVRHALIANLAIAINVSFEEVFDCILQILVRWLIFAKHFGYMSFSVPELSGGDESIAVLVVETKNNLQEYFS